MLLQRPTTIEALRTAADVADASTRSAGDQSRECAASAQMAELRAMMANMQALLLNGHPGGCPGTAIAIATTPCLTANANVATAQRPAVATAPNAITANISDWMNEYAGRDGGDRRYATYELSLIHI